MPSIATTTGWLLRLGCPQNAADLAQDTFIKILASRQATQIDEPRAFLTTIAKRVLCNYYRRLDSTPLNNGTGSHDLALSLALHSAVSQDIFKTTHNLLIGGTGNNGLGGALLYSGPHGDDWREHSNMRLDDVILKGRFQPNEFHSFSAMTQYYAGEADMHGRLSVAVYRNDPFQSTRLHDKFWGRHTLASVSYEYTPNTSQKLNVAGFFSKTPRNGYLDQGHNLTLSPREYWVRGLETRFSQGFELGERRHEIDSGYR